MGITSDLQSAIFSTIPNAFQTPHLVRTSWRACHPGKEPTTECRTDRRGGGAVSPRGEIRKKGRGRHNQGWAQKERASIAGAAIAVQGCDDPGESGLHAYWQHAL